MQTEPVITVYTTQTSVEIVKLEPSFGKNVIET